jgi:hypothetical protein
MRRRGLPAATFSAHDELEARTGDFARHQGPPHGLFGNLQLVHRGTLGRRHRS